MQIKWLAKKVKALFRVKDKSLHQAGKIYKDVWSCDGGYISETTRNVKVRWYEHNNPIAKSNPSKHIKNNLNHVFNWSVLANALKIIFQQNVIQTYYIVLEKPTLNELLEPDQLNLYQNLITWLYCSINILSPWVFKF